MIFKWTFLDSSFIRITRIQDPFQVIFFHYQNVHIFPHSREAQMCFQMPSESKPENQATRCPGLPMTSYCCWIFWGIFDCTVVRLLVQLCAQTFSVLVKMMKVGSNIMSIVMFSHYSESRATLFWSQHFSKSIEVIGIAAESRSPLYTIFPGGEFPFGWSLLFFTFSDDTIWAQQRHLKMLNLKRVLGEWWSWQPQVLPRRILRVYENFLFFPTIIRPTHQVIIWRAALVKPQKGPITFSLGNQDPIA